MDSEKIKSEIENGGAILGIEFGSTRIKALLIDSSANPVAQGAFDWENSLVDGVWTYSLDEIHAGLRAAYGAMKEDARKKYGVVITRLRALGVSAMMHGYLAFDKNGTLLVPFRTWRNTTTLRASEELSALFGAPVPERWSVAHLRQAILNGESHVPEISFITTLAGYIHWKLSGRKVLGVGDASGMFPIDAETKRYDKKMLAKFSTLDGVEKYDWRIENILPEILLAGERAGALTKQGAAMLDAQGDLLPGAPLCPPEGDAGTGMVSTNSVAKRTGNVSAGTSAFAMVALEKNLSRTYNGKIDLVATPDGSPVAMAHTNNCTGEYDKWINLFGEAAAALGANFSRHELYDTLLGEALKGESDCGGLIPFNFISGEPIAGLGDGRPLFVRERNCKFTLANFMRAELFTSLAALRFGMDILFKDEGVKVDTLVCQGGFFKAADVGLRMMAAAMDTKVAAFSAAGEGGPWGMALLALYMEDGASMPLADWLERKVFARSSSRVVEPCRADVEGFDKFFERYKKALAVEKAAVESVD